MEAKDIAKLFLADWLVERFDIVRGDVNSREERMDIWLDEKKILPVESRLRASEVVSYGFTPESVIQDFPHSRQRCLSAYSSPQVAGGAHRQSLCFPFGCSLSRNTTNQRVGRFF